MSTAIAPDDEPVTLDSLWEALAYYIHCLACMFGTVRDIAEKHTLSRKDHFHLRNWLFRCEELFRRLLFRDAYEHHKHLLIGSRQSGVGSRGAFPTADCRLPTAVFDPDHPDQWRVTFQLSSYKYGAPASRRHRSARSNLEPLMNWRDNEFVILPEKTRLGPPASSRHPSVATEPCRQDAGGPQPPEPRLTYDSYPLARRVEALSRAVLNRETHAKRMARWLRRQNTPTLERFAKPLLSFQRFNTMPGDFAVADAAKFVAEILDEFCMLLLGLPPARVDSS